MTTTQQPKRQLTVFDCVGIILGIVIGAGIYETTPVIAAQAGNEWSLLGFWILGGLISLVGALCYVELATGVPGEGGDFLYLTRAYGHRVGFVFAWSEFWIVRPGNLGMMAFVFARYASALFPVFGDQTQINYDFLIYAAGSIVILSILNILGVKTGKWTQNILTLIKVVGLLILFGIGMVYGKEPVVQPISKLSGGSLALVLVLFTYGGWNEMSYVAAEVRNPNKNIFRSLLIGTLLLTAIYLLVNIAFLRSLGLEGVRNSKALAADAIRPWLGDSAARVMSLLVCISCLGSISGMIMTGSRVYYAVGTENARYGWLGKWSKQDSPLHALMLQMVIAVGLVVGIPLLTGANPEEGFNQLVNFTTPVFWFFVFMVSISLFIFRSRPAEPGSVQRVRLYPWLPAVFALMSSFLFSNSFLYALSTWSSVAYWSIGIVLVGVIVSHLTVSER